ncbi:MAG TPA: hypothetical protein DD409_01125 [Bacteroidales bacterium]|jgi:TonB family protein|nr:hypothetical protein [Bacteroidales bacterium]
MKPLVVYLLVFVAINLSLSAQEVHWFDKNWQPLPSKENASYFRVIDYDSVTAHLIVKDFYQSGKIYRTGSYLTLVPEIRDGQFVWYYKSGRVHKEMTYQGNLATSWRVLDEKGRAQLAAVLEFKGPNGEDLAEAMPVDKEPGFVGGKKALNAYIRKNLKYPASASFQPMEGTVIVFFHVDEQGKLSNFKVIQEVHPDLDRAALELVTNMPPWEPATVDGMPVSVPYLFPVKFYNRSAQGVSSNNGRGMINY